MRPTLLCLLFWLLLCCNSSYAAVELAPRGKQPVKLSDIYLLEGIPYVAVDDALAAVSLSGHWNSVTHRYRIKTRRGWAEISPGSSFLRFQDRQYPLKRKPRFIDGRLRVPEDFLLNQLSLLIDRPVYYRNLEPRPEQARSSESTLDRLFSFLLHKKKSSTGPLLRAVAIDPGHGGLDTGVIAPDGLKEKQVSLTLARQLTKLLKMRLGVPVYLSRDDDYELSSEQRLAPAAREDVDVWLLLHAQASFTETPKGVSLLVRPEQQAGQPAAAEGSASLRLARELAAAMRELEIPVTGIFPSALLPLGRGDLPTVQIELGYLSNPEDLARLQDAAQQKRLAQAIYRGMRNFAQEKKETR